MNGTQTKALRRNGAHVIDIDRSKPHSRQTGANQAMTMGDIRKSRRPLGV